MVQGLIRPSEITEGIILNKWLDSRMIRKNQNVLLATTGSTGSGKSYFDLSFCNHWYEYHFKKQFPIENCCFSIRELMQRLNSGELGRGSLLILEEAGVNLNSLDFQNKISKVFTFVLQSFRSLNIGIVFNLPVLDMLNKSTRLLIHSYFITDGIDYQNKKNFVKAYRRQINQKTGKVYDKFFRVTVNRKAVKVKRFTYSIPPQDLLDAYESKKFKFVSELSANFLFELEQLDKKSLAKQERKELTEVQQQVYDLVKLGKNVREIAKIRGVIERVVYHCIKAIKKKGYDLSIG